MTITVETSGFYPNSHSAHNRYLEERKSPITCNTDVRNVKWLDRALLLSFLLSFIRQTTDFDHSTFECSD
jgi:hypothetical protein